MCFSSFYHKIMFSAVKNAKAVLISYFHSYNSFSYAEKKTWHMWTNFWINPHNGKLPSRLAPAQCQNSLAPQLLSNNYWSKIKTSISLNRVYWYDTMCHTFSCYFWFNIDFHSNKSMKYAISMKANWMSFVYYFCVKSQIKALAGSIYTARVSFRFLLGIPRTFCSDLK